jgi:diguanylate cyclase (GGDEF)-like protein
MAISISFADDDATDKNKTILIVDDEPSIVNLLRDYLADRYTCITANSGTEALQKFEANEIAVVLSDVQMREMSGLELLPLINDISPNTVCLMVSGEQSMETAIGALKVGAVDFIRKPFTLSDVGGAVAQAIEKHSGLISKIRHDEQLRELVTQQRSQLDFLRNYDPLTGLYNHLAFTKSVSRAVAAATRDQMDCGAIAVFSLERFKAVKESFGADVADAVLNEIAGRWMSALPADAVLARFEMEEFGLLLPQNNCSTDAIEVLRTLGKTLKEPVNFGSRKFHFSITAGISIFPNDGTDAVSLEKFAAIAMRHSRANGSSISFYEPEMNLSAERRVAVENGLKLALEAGEIENYYQPKIDFVSGKIVGMEALVRWNSSEFGPVPASEIVEIAEQTGLIELLGLCVLETACHDTSRLNKDGFELQVSVNLSGQQLANDWFPQAVARSIRASELLPAHLELEITETSLIQNAVSARKVLDAIRSLGVRLAIDDFGTGFSSLSYLKRFPLDTLKVDRSFVCDLESRASDAEFVNAIVALAQKLNLRTVVEGVETTEQLDLLRSSGCDEWQGFLCSKPLPFAEFRDLVLSAA